MADPTKLDRYRVVRTLGRGGMGTVLLADDTVLGRQVALKRVTAAAGDSGLLRLRREALVGASINHPNLVSIYDVSETDEGDLVIVMEFVDGETLRDAIARRGPLRPEEALSILEGTAAGLDAIHGQGIVHRDVKPANILISHAGEVKLADLGIASVPDRTQLTTQGSIVGSFGYMAPEQMYDTEAAPAIDIYALAAVAYEALSGERARGETNPVALAYAMDNKPPPDLRDALPGAPAAAATVLARAMDRDPSRRPRSAGELVDRLRPAFEAPATTQRAARSTPRRPAVIPAAAAVPAAAAPAAAAPADAAPAGPARTTRSRVAEPVRRERSRRLLPLAALALVALIAIVAVALASSGGGGSGTHAPPARAHHGSGAPATAGKGASAPASSSSGSASASASTTAAGGAGASSSASSSASTPTTSSPPAGSPANTASSFYTLAAGHHYPQAWALADPSFQSQLGGYDGFRSTFAGDRSITVDSVRTLSKSASAASLAITTTSVRNDGTQHCSGTVDLSSGSSGHWLLHHIQINCH